MAISSPLQSKVPTGSTQTIKKLQTILLNRTKVRREIFQQQTLQNQWCDQVSHNRFAFLHLQLPQRLFKFISFHGFIRLT